MADFDPVPGQLYKIINAQFTNQAADLLDGNPTGTVAGYHVNNDSNNQSWYIARAANSTYTFQNGTATGSFANVSDPQVVGDQLRGNPTATLWRIITRPNNVYSIATDVATYVWVLSDDQDRTPIVLGPYGGNNTYWSIVEA